MTKTTRFGTCGLCGAAAVAASKVTSLRGVKRTKHSRPSVAALLAGVCLIWAAPSLAQQASEPRLPGVKLNLGQMQALPSATRVVVKFREGRSIRQSARRLTGNDRH